MTEKRYGDKVIVADGPCPSCVASGGDSTGNHLVHWKVDNGDEFVHCGRCGHHEKITEGNKDYYEENLKVSRTLSDEEVSEVLEEAEELPIMALESRGITHQTAERFGVRVGLSSEDGKTPISHFYPKTVEGTIVGYKVRSLSPKYFYAVGRGSGCDFFGINQTKRGDVYSQKLFIFEDELSAMSGYQALTEHSTTSYRPACVSLPDGSKSLAAVFGRNRDFLDSFSEIVVCMDNDEAGEEAIKIARSLYPDIKVARINPGRNPDGSDVKDANDMIMGGNSRALFNVLRFSATTEIPSSAVSVSECIDRALEKPTWG